MFTAFHRIAIYSVLLSLAAAFYSAASVAENEIAILTPQDQADVKSYVIVKGTANITDDSVVWVLAHRKDLSNQWWPQDEPKMNGDQWTAVANIGIPRDIGHEFEIAVATFSPDALLPIKQYFEIAKELDKYLPISFPKTTSNIEIVTVKKVGH